METAVKARFRGGLLKVIALCWAAVCLTAESAGPLWAEKYGVLEGPAVRIIFEPGLEATAKEAASVYPEALGALEKLLGWGLDAWPEVFLTRDRQAFERAAENKLAAAFALPSKNLIVVECSRGFPRPFRLKSILKHELGHLLLHERIRGVGLPRWFEEGVCQWAGDGVDEILTDREGALLEQAALSGRLIPLRYLESGFPEDDYSFRLAYEQSKSMILFILDRHGREGLLGVLRSMESGMSLDDAVEQTFGVTVGGLERAWRQSLRQSVSWFTYLSANLYEILFLLSALVSGYAFFRAWLRKRRYLREMPDNPEDTG